MSRIRLCGAAILAISGLGCPATSFRAPGRELTLGVFDALQHPDDPLIGKLRTLLDRELDAALAGPTPKKPGDTLGRMLSNALKAAGDQLASSMPGARREIVAIVREAVRAIGADARSELIQMGPTLGTFVSDVLSHAAEGVLTHRQELIDLAGDVARRAGHEFMRGATEGILDVVQERIGPDGRGPLSNATLAAGERSSKAQMAGMVAAITDAFPTICPQENRSACIHALVQSYARSATAGAVEGIGKGSAKVVVWPIVVAAVSALLLGALLAWLIGRLTIRRKHAGQQEGRVPPMGRGVRR